MNAVKKDELQPVFGSLPWGVCPFSAVEKQLLNVRSANRLPDGAKSVLTVLFPYLLEEKYYTDARLSRYAVPADYHVVCGEILENICCLLSQKYPENRFVPFVDASPIPEVQAACFSGLGIKGKNGLLIHKEYGSWVFIGEIVTDLTIEYAPIAVRSCIGCLACVRACPTGALTQDGHNAQRCLSHISQKKKLTAEDELLLQEHNCLWGCDRCQTVCPMNANAKTTPISAFRDTASALTREIEPPRAYAWRKDAIFRNLSLLDKYTEEL